jgi:hypothetical protein
MFRKKACETCEHSGLLPFSALNSTLRQKGTSGENKRLRRFYEFLEQKKARKRGSNVLVSLQRVLTKLGQAQDKPLARCLSHGRPPIQDEFTYLRVSRQDKWRLRMQKECRCVKCGRPRPCRRH